MALVPLLDFRNGREESSDPRDAESVLPTNNAAEQALLGILLYDNEQFWQLPTGLTASAFFEPFHGRLFSSIKACLSNGLGADPIMLSQEFLVDPAFKELGGVRYFADLVEKCPPPVNAPHYARAVIETWTRRRLITMGKALAEEALNVSMEEGGSAVVISNLESDLMGLALADERFELTEPTVASSRVLARLKDRTTPVGIKTGLAPLDLQLGALTPGQVILIGGRPSMGKSPLVSAICSRVASPHWWTDETAFGRAGPTAEDGRGVIMINGEMDVDQMTRRFLGDIGFRMFRDAFPTPKQIHNQAVDESQMRMIEAAQKVFDAMPIKTMKRTGLKISQIRSICRRQVAQWARAGIKLGLVAIDHVGLTRAEGKTGGRYEAQSEVAISTKELADDLGCPVAALIQLSREVDKRPDKHPTLADLRDSGFWEEIADVVLFPYREAYYAKLETEPSPDDITRWDSWQKRRLSKTMEVAIAKGRDGGAGNKVELWAALDWNAVRGIDPGFGDLIP